MKTDLHQVASSPKQDDVADESADAGPKTVSDVIEHLGLTGHHHQVLLVCIAAWFCSGWTTTLVTLLLDGASHKDGDWVALTSPRERLTIQDRSFALLAAGIVAAACNFGLGNLSDVLGRILIVQFGVIICAFASIGLALASGKLMLIVYLLLLQFDISALAAQTMLAEWLPIHWRAMLLVLINAMWNFGRLAITVLWAFLPPTKHWQNFFFAASVLPIVFGTFLVVRGYLYESPRWLAVVGRTERCIDLLRLAAASASSDRKALPAGWDDVSRLQLDCDSGGAVDATQQRSAWMQLSELSDPKLKRLIVVLGLCFFSLGFAWSALFYWVIEYLRTVGAEKAVVPVMMAAPFGKITAVAILMAPYQPGKCVVDRCPRTLLMKMGFVGCAVSVCSLCLTTSVVLLTLIMFSSQVFEGFVWQVGTVYMAEAFPTTIRNSATGLTWLLGASGGIISAALIGELMEIWVYLPMVAIASLLMSGFAACFLLSDEKATKPLADTIGYGSCDAKSSRSTSK